MAPQIFSFNKNARSEHGVIYTDFRVWLGPGSGLKMIYPLGLFSLDSKPMTGFSIAR